MTQFVRGANPIWFMVDNVGLPLNDEYYAFFLTNTLPYLFQNVYQDPNGAVQWSNPLQFQPNGTLPNNLYFDDALTYRIEIRRGATQSDPLVGNPIQNYTPGDSSSSVITNPLTIADNMITNPQFSDVYFPPTGQTYTQTVSGTYTVPIGPGWNLVLVGTGTTVLTQTPIDGASQFPGNPTYYLTVNSTGWTSAQLIQTFSNNGAIFSGGAIAFSLDAFTASLNQLVTVTYEPSVGATTTLLSKVITTGALFPYSDAVNIPSSTNTDVGNAAFVNIVINLPGTSNVSLANIQLLGQSTPLSGFNNPIDIPAYEEQTYERTVDHEFNVYRDSIIIQPKSSLLVGWNFGLNPFQFTFSGAPTVTTVTPIYVADQTIIKAEQASSLAVAFDPAVSGNIEIASIGATTQKQFALFQYIDASTMYGFWGTSCSVLVKAYLNNVTATPVYLKARLFWSSSNPSTLSPTEPISSYDANGNPVLSGSWTQIISPDDNKYPIGTADSLHPFTGEAYTFNNFTLPSGLVGQTLGIMIYIVGKLDQAAGQTLVINSVSLVPNEFAIDSTPQSFDQVLRQCEYYYEKSYALGTYPSITTVGQKFATIPLYLTGGGNDELYLKTFQLIYKTVKRVNPTNTFYSPASATGGFVQLGMWLPGTGYAAGSPTDIAISEYTITAASTDRVTMVANNASIVSAGVATNAAHEGIMYYHYTSDARLGLV